MLSFFNSLTTSQTSVSVVRPGIFDNFKNSSCISFPFEKRAKVANLADD